LMDMTKFHLTMRKRVSESLMRFSVLEAGRYYLSCREFYDIYDLKVPHARLDSFDTEDQEKYAASFLKIYGVKLDVPALLSDLRSRGMGDLLAHPLLLALICIVKSGRMSVNSRSVITLIDRAIDTLSFRWDEGKGIARESTLPVDVDGRDRIRCLARIAFNSPDTRVDERRALALAQDQLELLRWETVDPKRVLLETARFYGIFVPTSGGEWQFVHKTLHDFLGARLWVENGLFYPAKIREWSAKAAYAACLTSDATNSMLATLKDEKWLPAFAEMLSNDASFDHTRIAMALISHYEEHPREHYYRAKSDQVEVQLSQDFISIASTKFLIHLTDVCADSRSRVHDSLIAYALAELLARDTRIPQQLYGKLVGLFRSDRFSFRVYRVHQESNWVIFPLSQLKRKDK
jgi:hypothetical protein